MQILGHCPVLTHLSFAYTPLKPLVLGVIASLCPHLVELNLTNSIRERDRKGGSLDSLARGCPLLRTLWIHECTALISTSTQDINCATPFPSLEVIESKP